MDNAAKQELYSLHVAATCHRRREHHLLDCGLVGSCSLCNNTSSEESMLSMLVMTAGPAMVPEHKGLAFPTPCICPVAATALFISHPSALSSI
jgi:hypothetical protein